LDKEEFSNLTKIGLGGRGSRDYPVLTEFLVEQGVNSIFFNLDALIIGINNINQAEESLVKLGMAESSRCAESKPGPKAIGPMPFRN